MDPITMILLFLGIFGTIISGVSAANSRTANANSIRETNEANKEMQDSANETNLKIAEDANAAQQMESRIAYERSTAGAQVQNMMQAGMSRAGAINALNGGGSYTPAPINTAQVQASQNQAYQRDPNDAKNIMDSLFGGLSNVGQHSQMSKQLKQQQAAQEETARANKAQESIQREALEKDNELKTEQITAAKRENIMSAISSNPEKRAALGRLRGKVDPVDYKSAFAYIKDVAEQAGDDRSYVDDTDIRDALVLDWQSANQGKNVSAGTKNLDANTAKTKKETEQLAAVYEEWKSSPQANARKMEAQIRQLQATFNVDLTQRELDAYMASVGVREYYDADGEKHEVHEVNYTFRDSVRAFFKQLHTAIPDAKDMAAAASLVIRK